MQWLGEVWRRLLMLIRRRQFELEAIEGPIFRKDSV